MTPKTLVWKKGWHRTEIGDYISKTALGEYSCRKIWSGRWTLWFRERCLGDEPGGIQVSLSLEETQEKAQQHFNKFACQMVKDLMEEEL